jgi:serine protease Do
MVQDVRPQSPAERAGLRPYDVIVQVDSRSVSSNEELIRDISARQPGTVARLEILREGRRHTLPVKLAERPRRGQEFEQSPGAIGAPVTPRAAQPVSQPPLGVSVREMDREFSGRLQIPDTVEGVIVSRVDPTGAAHQVLRRGVIIMEINRRPTRTVADYQRVLSSMKPGEIVAIYYYDPAVGQRTLATVTID